MPTFRKEPGHALTALEAKAAIDRNALNRLDT
jgi:hypothetical protein